MIVYGESWVSITNEALSRIGSSQIDSLSGASIEVGFCNKLLPSAIRVIFGTHNWNCAKARTQLSPTTDIPTFGYDHYFQLPSNFSKVVEISSIDYKIEGDRILADDDIINMIYIFLPEDATEINPPILRSALVACLAYKLSTPLSGSNSLATQLYSEFSQMVTEAKTQNDALAKVIEDDVSENTEEIFGYTPLWINER
jgi:hypothetical protein